MTLPLTLPNINVATTQGTLALNAHRPGLLVLYFYPKDAPPGCTTEAQQFNSLYAEFKKRQVTILGVSRDSLASHQRFCEKQSLAFDLITDADETLCQHFGVINMKTLYGKLVRGIERSTFIIDQKGHVLHEWRKVKAEGHAQEVLAWIDANT